MAANNQASDEEDEFTREYYRQQDEALERGREAARRDDEALKHEVWSCKVGDYLELTAPIKLITRDDRTPHPDPSLGRIYRVDSLRGRHFHLVPVDDVPQDDIGMFNSEISGYFKVVAPPADKGGTSKQLKRREEKLRAVGLPTEGEHPYIPPPTWTSSQPIPKVGKSGGYRDKDGEEWKRPRGIPVGEKPSHWDVVDPNGGHRNITPEGTIHHGK